MPARTPLMIASSIGDVNQMTALLASDANNLFVQDARGWNALVYAAVGGKLEAVKVKSVSLFSRVINAIHEHILAPLCGATNQPRFPPR